VGVPAFGGFRRLVLGSTAAAPLVVSPAMQLTPVAQRSVPAARNVFTNMNVVFAGPVVDGTQKVVQDTINFGALPKRAAGATRVTSEWIDGVNRKSWYETFRQSSVERAASDALADAIDGSGLIALLQPTGDDRAQPAAGHTRIFFDKRSLFIDFANDAVPVAAQAVLDAVTAYRMVAAAAA